MSNLVISFRLLFGKKLVMDGQNFKNFVITILQVNKIDPVSWSVSQSVIQTERQTDRQSVSQSVIQTERQTVSQSVIQTERQTVSQSVRQSDSQTCNADNTSKYTVGSVKEQQ